MIDVIVSFAIGAIVGALVARNNIKKLNGMLDEAVSFVEKAEQELTELRAKQRTKRKTTGTRRQTKKTQTKK